MICRVGLALLFILPFHTLLAQNEVPCKSYPMNGYSGDCNISTLLSMDGKYMYTSDKLTLKKWDIATQKVVDEFSPFPYRLGRQTENSDRIIGYSKTSFQDEEIVFDLKTRKEYNKALELNGLLTAEGKKTFEKYTAKESSFQYDVDVEDKLVLMRVDKQLYKLDATTNKVSQFKTMDSYYYKYLPDQNLIFSEKLIINAITGKEYKRTSLGDRSERIYLSPDKKYWMILSSYNLIVVDYATLQHVQTVDIERADENRIIFKPDLAGFYVYSFYMRQKSYQDLARVHVFTYPTFAKEREIAADPVWRTKNKSNLSVFWDAEHELLFTHEEVKARGTTQMRRFDIKTGTEKEVLSFAYRMASADQEELSTLVEKRNRIGNAALNSLFDLEEQPIHNNFLASTNYVDDFNDDGYVLIRHTQFSNEVVLWKFPEGKALQLYYVKGDSSKQTGLGDSPVEVKGLIGRSFMSPDAKIIGLNTTTGAYFYEGAKLMTNLPSKNIIKIFANKALVYTVTEFANELKDMQLIDLSTGKILQQVKGKDVPGCWGCIDTQYAPDKVFFSNVGKPEVFVFDLSNPEEVLSWDKVKAAEYKYIPFYFENKMEPYITNRYTGKRELINGFTMPEKRVFRYRYFLGHTRAEGFSVFDLETGKSITTSPLYSGWMDYDNLLYFKNLGKILAVSAWPRHTFPNAKPEDPGATAFTIDVTSGEITPYLLTGARSGLKSARLKREAAVYVYNPNSECERESYAYKEGTCYSSYSDAVIILGYDCNLKRFVAAYRQQDRLNNRTYLFTRTKPMTAEELKRYSIAPQQMKICPSCHGQPAGYYTSTYTGWTDWEQTSLNIYVQTRKYVKNQKTTTFTDCGVCLGQSWVKK